MRDERFESLRDASDHFGFLLRVYLHHPKIVIPLRPFKVELVLFLISIGVVVATSRVARHTRRTHIVPLIATTQTGRFDVVSVHHHIARKDIGVQTTTTILGTTNGITGYKNTITFKATEMTLDAVDGELLQPTNLYRLGVGVEIFCTLIRDYEVKDISQVEFTDSFRSS
jgi:hypothetical protein